MADVRYVEATQRYPSSDAGGRGPAPPPGRGGGRGVGLGRAVAHKRSVFVRGEPLSNLDAKLRVQMRADIAALQHDLGTTTVYVTHDQAEAMTLGHRVAVLDNGLLQQCGTPRDLYDRPGNRFVAGFIGSPAMNLCELAFENGGVSFGSERVPVRAEALNGASSLVLGLRPEALELVAEGIPARVEVVEEFGADAFVFCSAEIGGSETRLVARTEARLPPRRGARRSLPVRPGEAHLFDAGRPPCPRAGRADRRRDERAEVRARRDGPVDAAAARRRGAGGRGLEDAAEHVRAACAARRRGRRPR